jgi:Flp pilus assembly protein TadG
MIFAAVRPRWRSLLARSSRAFNNLLRDNKGGAAILVALSLPVVISALGLGVDTGAWYVEANRVRQIADSAALGGARAMASGLGLSTAQGFAQRDAARNGYTGTTGDSLVVNSPPTSGAYAGKKGAVEVIATRTLPSLFSRYILGATARTVSSRSVAYSPPVQNKNLEVAMVLDVSSSMAGSTETRGVTKMQAQQSAANQLIDAVIQANQSKYTSRVALAPFSSSVNVGSDYFRAATNKSVSGSWTGVVERPGSYKFKDDLPSSTTKYFGDFKTKHSSAMGDYSDYVQDLSSQTPGSANTIQPLSSSTSGLHDDVDALSSNGTTAAHLGLAWAWYMLSPKWNTVFSGANVPTAYDTDQTYKAIVVLSDFDFNSYYESANGTANAQFEALCTAIKATGVKIYTVGYNVSGSDNNARRINCASPDQDGLTYTYTTTTVDDLVSAFKVAAAQSLAGASEMQLRIVE